MKPIVILSILIMTSSGCSRSDEKTQPLGELGMARAAAERGDVNEAIQYLDESISTKPSLEAYELRSELFWNRGKRGAAQGDIQMIANKWPSDKRLAALLDKYQTKVEEEAIAEARIFFGSEESLLDGTRDHFRESVEFLSYWKKQTPSERDAYIESVEKNGFYRLHIETTLRQLIAGIGGNDQEARILSSLKKLAPTIAEFEKKSRGLAAGKQRNLDATYNDELAKLNKLRGQFEAERRAVQNKYAKLARDRHEALPSTDEMLEERRILMEIDSKWRQQIDDQERKVDRSKRHKSTAK